MLTESELIERLKGSEGPLMERKKSFHEKEVKEVLVAFANSLPENQQAVLFVGVAPDGKPVGVPNADKCQQDIFKLAQESCYPPVPCKPTVLKHEGVEVVAAVVQHSKLRPHFVGHAFVRIGSESRKVSAEMLDELIASRNDKARRILQEKNELVTVLWITVTNQPPGPLFIRDMMSQARGNPSNLHGREWKHEKERECRIQNCDAHVLRLLEVSTGTHFAAPLETIKISFDEVKHRTKLVIDER